MQHKDAKYESNIIFLFEVHLTTLSVAQTI
jgi:hypothetical protein